MKDSLIYAGGTYGGEWTRDISINAWNAASLLTPEYARFSLLNVTTDNKKYIGHQYWDQIIWVTGAYNHYLITHDFSFLKQAYIASKNTIEKLEKKVFDAKYGLFTGPSVFNDGIAGYEEPVYQKEIYNSYVLNHPNSKTIKCLSTNCIYYNAYEILAQMAKLCNDYKKIDPYIQKAQCLRNNIRKYLFDSQKGDLAYLIDHNGEVHHFQEGLGLSFAILTGILNDDEAKKLVAHTYVSPYGLPSIYPCFKRFSKEKPGRHNVMIWPFVNAFWAQAALQVGHVDKFIFELENLTNLVVDSNDCFFEIYNSYTGKVSGGWQSGTEDEWKSIHHQTWSATGYIAMLLRGVLGMNFTEKGIILKPNVELLDYLGFEKMTDLRYQQGTLSIKKHGDGKNIHEIRLDGIKCGKNSVFIKAPHQGEAIVDIYMD